MLHHKPFGAACAWLLLLLSGCVLDGTQGGRPGGIAVVSLASVPADVSCLLVTVRGRDRIERTFDVDEEAPDEFVLRGLPLGEQVFKGSAFAQPCAALDPPSAQASWESDDVAATLVAHVPADVRLVMRRTGRAQVTVEFDQDTVDASAPDAGGSEGGSPDAATDAALLPDSGPPFDTSEDYACGKRLVTNETLLDLGHGHVDGLSVAAGRIVSIESSGHWVLWDQQTRQQIISGEGGAYARHAVGRTSFAIFRPGGMIDVRDLHGGGLLASFATGVEFTLESDYRNASMTGGTGISMDGNYLWARSCCGLHAWSLSGELLTELPGSFGSASVFAAADELRTARSLDTSFVVERIPVPGNAVASSFTVQGMLGPWFADGTHLLAGGRVYSIDGSLRATLPLPLSAVTGGYGSFAWWQGRDGSGVENAGVARIDTGEIVWSTSAGHLRALQSGSRVLFFDTWTADYWVVRLDQLDPVLVGRRLPSIPQVFSADATSEAWAVGTAMGVIYASDQLSAMPAEPFGCGAVLGVAGSNSGRIAVATADGQVRIIDLEGGAFRRLGRLPVLAQAIALSADGRTLAVRLGPASPVETLDSAVRLHSLPDGALLFERVYSTALYESIVDMSLAADGQTFAHAMCVLGSINERECRLDIHARDGTPLMEGVELGPPVDPSGPPYPTVLLSPSGDRFAVQIGGRSLSGSERVAPSTNVYENGTLIGAFNHGVMGWVDEAHLFMTRHSPFRQYYLYVDTIIADLTGEPTGVGPFAFSAERTPQVLDGTYFYAPVNNKVFSLIDGSAVWSGPTLKASPGGGVAGSHVVYPAETHRIDFQRWQ